MLINQLPRMILATMFLSIVGLGYAAKMNQHPITFVSVNLDGAKVVRS